jgi:hypothetical protein
MSSKSRSYTGAALLAACMSIPSLVQAQTSTAEQGLMNRVGPGFRSQINEHQLAAIRPSGDQAQASRALLGTIDPVRVTVSDDYSLFTSEQALLGQPASVKTGEEK